MNRKLTVAALLLALCVVGATGFWWRSSAAPASDALTLFGNVDIRQVSLAFDDSARIRTMQVEEGDHVHAGQVLATLDTRTMELEAAQTRARIAAAEADAQLAAQALQRVQQVVSDTDGRGVSRQEHDRVVAQQASTQARLEEQKQALALLQHHLALAELKAPSDAVVRSRLAEPGDMASPQKPVYALALTQPKWIRAYIDEPRLVRVQPGMSAQIEADGLPGEALTGQVGYISSVAEFTPKSVQTPELRTSLVYEIRVLVTDPQDRLRLGMPVTLRLSTEPRGPHDGR